MVWAAAGLDASQDACCDARSELRRRKGKGRLALRPWRPLGRLVSSLPSPGSFSGSSPETWPRSRQDMGQGFLMTLQPPPCWRPTTTTTLLPPPLCAPCPQSLRRRQLVTRTQSLPTLAAPADPLC